MNSICRDPCTVVANPSPFLHHSQILSGWSLDIAHSSKNSTSNPGLWIEANLNLEEGIVFLIHVLKANTSTEIYTHSRAILKW